MGVGMNTIIKYNHTSNKHHFTITESDFRTKINKEES